MIVAEDVYGSSSIGATCDNDARPRLPDLLFGKAAAASDDTNDKEEETKLSSRLILVPYFLAVEQERMWVRERE